MDPVPLSVMVDGEGFDALHARLRDRLTPDSIFVETEQLIAVDTLVTIEVRSHQATLFGRGSVADVRTAPSGVVVSVEWADASRPIIDRILSAAATEPPVASAPGPVPAAPVPAEPSWADALFGEAPPLPPPKPAAAPSPPVAPAPAQTPDNGADAKATPMPPELDVDEKLAMSEGPLSEPSLDKLPMTPTALDASWTPSDNLPKFESVDLGFADEVSVDVPAIGASGLVTDDVPPEDPEPEREPEPEPPPVEPPVVAAPIDPGALPSFPGVKPPPAAPPPAQPPAPPPESIDVSIDVMDAPTVREPSEDLPIEEDFQALIDETIGDESSAQAIIHGRAVEAPTPAPLAPAPPPPMVEPRPAHLTPGHRDLGPKGDVVVGIDLGTTYSCAAIVENGEARVLATRRGRPTIASVVFYDESGRVFIGETAQKRGEVDPTRKVVGSKRLMGRPFHSPVVQEVKEHYAYPVVQGYGGEAAIEIDDKRIALEEVAADILKELREAASLQVKGRLNRAVITCPAYFNERQREAVRVAGELAGFHVERVLNEPTAAALHYGYKKNFDGRRLLVYDLGGGTFDVSLLEVTGDVYEVLATGGDTFLGGIDFDACIAGMLAEAFLEKEHIDPRTDDSAVARLFDSAEAAKRELSTMMQTVVQIEHLVVKPHAARSLSVPLKQKRVEHAFEPLIEQTLSVVQQVLQRSGVSIDQVHDVLLVGGQTRTPLVRRRVADMFGKQPLSSVHPDYAVALGAAQYAATLDTFDSIVLIDALPMSIGVALPGGRFKKIIDRDTRLSVERKYRLHTTKDNQKSFEVLVFQGESEWVHNNEPLGMLHVPNLPRGGRGEVKIDITLTVSEECILKMKAVETESGREVEAVFGTKDTPEELRGRLGLPPQPTHAEIEAQQKAANRPKGVWRWLTGLLAK